MDRTDANLYTSRQAAAVLGVSQEWVRQLYLSGRLAGKVTPLGRLYSRKIIDRLAAERKQQKQAANV
jgi:hypothetical protein